MAKESFTRAEVKNIKHGAIMGGVVLGALSLLCIGICIQKTTGANVVNGSTDLFDKVVDKIKIAIQEKKSAAAEGEGVENE